LALFLSASLVTLWTGRGRTLCLAENHGKTSGPGFLFGFVPERRAARSEEARPRAAPFNIEETSMKKIAATTVSVCLLMCVVNAFAQAGDAFQRAAEANAATKDSETRDVLAKERMKKDEMAKERMKKDAMAKERMRKDAMAKEPMKKESMAKEGLKKDAATKDGMDKEELRK
jgi:pentapeptide MXKDX repeat protein